ncbi:hypothetical protein OG729_38650 [Streptomyces sp. NBC_00210]|uniref:hypothetical protein n=1 Tax=unclassified Streptomyces TaxID=2593676 RepID=UPI003244CD17
MVDAETWAAESEADDQAEHHDPRFGSSISRDAHGALAMTVEQLPAGSHPSPPSQPSGGGA